MSEIKIVADKAHLVQETAALLVEAAADAIQQRGRFSMALSGGSTPKDLFKLLATGDYRLDWENIHIFWVDERCVPPDHEDSNYGAAKALLLDHVGVPDDNVYRMQGEIDPSQAAAEYEHQIRMFFGNDAARFDLILLGMGDDGHTTSLFPGTEAVDEQERLVVAHHVEKLEAWRITMTPPLLNGAAQVVFLVAGAGKAHVLNEVLNGPHHPQTYPAQVVRPKDGRLQWLIDEAAGEELTKQL